VSQQDTAHAWWSRLRHQGLLLSPVVMLERLPLAPEPAPFYLTKKLRDAYTRFCSVADARRVEQELEQAAILAWVDALLEHFVGHQRGRLARQHNIPEKLVAAVRIGTKTETIRPHRVVFADEAGTQPALLVMADSSPHVGRGRGRTTFARFLELLRGTGQRLGLLTNGHQFRLIYAGLDFESWCEWESERWFDDGEGTEELAGLRQLLWPTTERDEQGNLKWAGLPGLLEAVEESRKRQADLSSVLRENVRQAVELLLEEVSAVNRTDTNLFQPLFTGDTERRLTDTEAHEALLQATVRAVMRLVVCLFAESRQLLPVNDPTYAQSYGVRSLYELLEETIRNEGGIQGLLNRQTAWPRLMALFRVIHGGSAHGAFPFPAYGGVLFRPGQEKDDDAVSRALHILEHKVPVSDSTIHAVLRKLLRGPLPVLRGRAKTFVEGPVDYTDLRTEFIGLIYEGLLDYRLKRTDEKVGPQVFLNLGREPVLPLARLEDMLAKDKKGLKDLLTTLKKEKVTASAASEEEEADEETEDAAEEDKTEEETAEPVVEAESVSTEEGPRAADYMDAVEAAKRWAREAVLLASLVPKKRQREPEAEYQSRIEAEANRLIKRVVATGEFYLVRAGNTRKGTGTFYTRPQLAVPVVHRTLEPLGLTNEDDGTLVPKTPEEILGLNVCDPACGSASFLVAALHYLSDALYQSLREHCDIENPERAKRLTLPYGRPRTNRGEEDIVKFPPNDPHYGEGYSGWVKARLRRHVVEQCIYGVDINPLAVELARVSLWVETLDPELPFSFLDHKIKVGNSVVGCWLNRVLDYPLCAWEREGGDGKDGPLTQRIETFLKGEKRGNRRTGEGIIKQEMRQLIESEFRPVGQRQRSMDAPGGQTPAEVATHSRGDYERFHEHLPDADPETLERYYRDKLHGSPAVQQLNAAMDEWCAVWFWPADEKSLKSVPTPEHFHEANGKRADIVRRLASEVRFFHWEIEFPDVFTPERKGFDAMLGNPPWDVIEPSSQEFFSDFDPLYRTYDKQTALRQQQELFASVADVQEQWMAYTAHFKSLGNWARNAAEPFDVALARGAEEKSLKASWEKHREQHVGFADAGHPFRLIGTGKLNAYKLFCEVFWHLLRSGGRLGIILPTGIYSDFGTKDLRETLLFQGKIDLLYAFQNEKKIFTAADHRFKQVALMVTKGGRTRGFLTRFRMGVGDSPHAHEIPDDILRRDDAAMSFTPEDVKQNSPKTLSLVELTGERDLAVFRRIYAHSFRIGDDDTGWQFTYSQEINMTSDSKHFPSRESWEARGYKPDAYGSWIGPELDVALPFFQGITINQFDISQKEWTAGLGRGSNWTPIPCDNKRFGPKYLIAEETLRGWPKFFSGPKIGYRRVARSTDTRTFIGCVVVGFGCSDKLATLRVNSGEFHLTLLASGLANSFCFDFVTRCKIGGGLDWNLIEQLPFPRLHRPTPRAEPQSRLVMNVARLTFIHRRFAREWLRLKHLNPELASREWKHWWAVTEADRLRLRVEIDALCADLYGLDPGDFDWIVRDDPTDPKGFYRVDRHLPFRERLTGLAAAAFRALKDGKWSAEKATKLSNDDFFEIIGIPELTNADAAKAAKLPGPLIQNRDGCHVWKPETFTPDDPRHGWTWEDCWKDAVALLGSEEAVRAYVEGKKEAAQSPKPDGPADLFGEKLPPKQGRLY